MVKQGCLEGVGRLSGGIRDAIWSVRGGSLECMGRLSGKCREVV